MKMKMKNRSHTTKIDLNIDMDTNMVDIKSASA